LENDYDVTNLAFALPKNDKKRNAIVSALLAAAVNEEVGLNGRLSRF